MGGGRDWNDMRDRIIGLGEDSARKSFYPELQRRLQQLEETRERLRVSERNLVALFNSIHDAILIHDPQGRILEANRAAEELFGLEHAALLEREVADLVHDPAGLDGARRRLEAWWGALAGQGFLVGEWQVVCPGAQAPLDVEVALRPAGWFGAEALVAVVRDITSRRQAENDLRQAQKLESLGQLAGGVAHDTNNMLGVIIGYSDLLLENPRLTDPAMRAQLGLIRQAALHSGDLTRQLLAFARKQTIQPRRADLNVLLDDLQRMLRRLIGEDRSLVWRPSTSLWEVWVDPTQVSQVLVNLVVNARDATGEGGSIVLSTANQSVDAAYARAHPDAVPGDFVVVAVTDDGAGMEPEVLARVFEPFFTTKGLGKGTGLGLAMVYGIVRQNGGFVTVYSVPGEGTTFRLHIPRFRDPGVEAAQEARSGPAPGGTETILLVEDEEALLALARTMLEEAGYRVLAAPGPEAALELAAREPGPIHLLATDMIMPGMGGLALSQRIRELRGGTPVLYMSGYPAGATSAAGVLDPKLPFLQKPFTRRDLLLKVRAALEGVPDP
ncbi:MAG TPA: ATP-binding protein [Holophaga sp.]|nr:ATP-binding protein [Holophaga sp.]